MGTSRTIFILGFALAVSPGLWAYQTDQGIEASISNSYVFTNYLKSDNIAVHAKDGVVTLTGTVADDNDKFLAQNTAENSPEVKGVDNELQVREPLPAEYSDAWIALKVKTALLFHHNVSSVRTNVDVKNGIVTLSGYADDQAQKDLTSEYAKDIDGIKGVVNHMTIKRMDQNPNPSASNINMTIDDASITALVKLTLLVHQSTSVLRTHVETRHGVVTLTGTAKSDAEKSLVTKLVSDINGVNDVVNNMNVQP